MKFRCNFMINLGLGGWSEVWYQERDSFDAAVQPCKNLGAVRARLLGSPAVIKTVRISTVEKPHISSRISLNYAAEPPVTGLVADYQNVAVHATILDQAKKYQRSTVLRGVPDIWINRVAATGNYSLEEVANLKPRFDAYIASLRANGFMFRDRDGDGIAGTITEVTFGKTVGGAGQLTFRPGGGFTAGNSVTWSDLPAEAKAYIGKGSNKITKIDGVDAVLNVDIPEGVLPTNWGPGKVQLKRTGYFNAYYGFLNDPTTRDTGRPFGLRRGRQPAQQTSQ